MSFVSVFFVAFYLVALAWRVVAPSGSRLYAFGLLLLSWTFYAWHAPQYLVLLVLTTVVDWVVGRWLEAEGRAQNTRRALLFSSLALNVGLLGYFKYAGLFAASVSDLFGRAESSSSGADVAHVLLPIGISFYTFMSMSYTIDVYRRIIPAERDFIRFASFLSFFPHLVAGPIVRGREFLYQLRRRRPWHGRVFAHGAYLIVRGLFFKIVIADNLGRIVDGHWQAAAGEGGSGGLAFSLLVFFAAQLFADFSGYTDIARGISYQLGFRLPINFNAPYIAGTFADFWRRWHISLSSWMRDYVYVPLGGSRHGAVRTLVNLLLVMAVCGLWHGANWKFAVWGLGLGLAAATEHALGLTKGPRSRWGAAAWYGVVQLTWILSLSMFRAASVAEGWQILRRATGVLTRAPLEVLALAGKDDLVRAAWWLLLPIVALHGSAWLMQRGLIRAPGPIEKGLYAGAMAAAALMLYTTTRQFIYFQF